MVLVLGGIKGGSGKTTLATNLAVLRASLGRKTLLVDADEQRSTSDWAEQREALGKIPNEVTTISLFGKSLYSQLQKMMDDYDDVIVDTGGRDTTSQRSALMIAKKFLIPFKPRSFDVWTIGSVQRLIEEVQVVNQDLKSYYVINQGDSRGSDNAEAMKIIEEVPFLIGIPSTIGYRKAFSNASSEGLGIIEVEKSDKKAISELMAFHDFIYG